MGVFASFSGIVGKNYQEVVKSLVRFAQNRGGAFEPAQVKGKPDHFCILQQQGAHTTISYPDYFVEWDECAEFLSQDLNTAVFSFHVHDGLLWLYTFFVNGETADQYSPMPDFFEKLTGEEVRRWDGNVQVLAQYIPGLDPVATGEYLVRWEGVRKDAVEKLRGFIGLIGLPYPFDENGRPTGQAYRFWTHASPLEEKEEPAFEDPKKPWWKFW
ncbi:hypothetical protein [Dinghuibacter silviterrae]|uniref:Uncharacterized protein n=1 Tax=Dinghuibacter silviterrae TaxID=1539049 RepID=A0A4R8DG95_9BACT|nr:hypothetical protein [Dinghuibacter silviterrae]TDW96388.1 hypothetical protein EDB95_4217 [Dinghuibacter silviterrae]